MFRWLSEVVLVDPVSPTGLERVNSDFTESGSGHHDQRQQYRLGSTYGESAHPGTIVDGSSREPSHQCLCIAGHQVCVLSIWPGSTKLSHFCTAGLLGSDGKDKQVWGTQPSDLLSKTQEIWLVGLDRAEPLSMCALSTGRQAVASFRGCP